MTVAAGTEATGRHGLQHGATAGIAAGTWAAAGAAAGLAIGAALLAGACQQGQKGGRDECRAGAVLVVV